MTMHCTEFCSNLNTLRLENGLLPSHDQLVAHLPPTDEGHWGLGLWRELQQRTQCGFCQLVVTAVLENVGLEENEGIDPEQQINVLIFPDEQSFRLSYPGLLGTRLVFVATESTQARGADTARLISRNGIDVSRVERWLQICGENHKICSHSLLDQKDQERLQDIPKRYPGRLAGRFQEDATSNFRVIDLKLSCIRRVALDTRYVTLSYVWGQLPMFKLQKTNFEKLSKEGSLQEIRGELPHTINDAIELTKALGERYLWIDGLSLVQDDANDVSLGIEMMNSIYHGSYFTIVAASGSDANAGLPGFNQRAEDRRQQLVTREVATGINMTILHGIDRHLGRSTYNERGWTLQEFVLPSRTIIFINGQVYFRCQEANWGEETWADNWAHARDADDSNIMRIPDSVDGFLPSCWAYQKLCEDFSHRKLRSDGDALRAMAGVTRPMAAGMETMMIEGLPGYYLDHFLLFIASEGNLRRRDRFASFSWAGWEGQIMWPRENFLAYNGQEDGSFKKTQETDNILKYLKHSRIIDWESLPVDAFFEHLSYRPYGMPSLLLELMREYPRAFPTPRPDMDPLRDRRFRSSPYGSGASSHGDIPHWDSYPSPRWDRKAQRFGEDEMVPDCTARKSGTLRPFSIKALNLANGQAEFDRLVARMDDKRAILALSNWLAGRGAHARRAAEERSNVGPRHVSRDDVKSLSVFRYPRASGLVDEDGQSARADRRVQQGEKHVKRNQEKVNEQDNDNDGPRDIQDIPKFPPYTVLSFVTLSMRLKLGSSTSSARQGSKAKLSDRSQSRKSALRSAFDRIPGIPLHSKTGNVVGSLHPDNIDLLDAPGSPIELLVIARCHTPTVGSALLKSDEPDVDRPRKLLWVMHIIWLDGIAERRGIGQVLGSALETALEPGPQVRSILLG